MRLVATIVVAAAVLAAPQASAKPGHPSQLLAFVGSGQEVAVVKLDALTLKPVSRKASTGIADTAFVALVAGGGRAAFSTASAALRFLDFNTMRWEFRIAYPGRPAAALWSYADKLVTLNQGSTAEVIVVDPTRRRLGAFRPLGGSLAGFVTLRDRIVALIAPLDGIGKAKLAVVDERGRARTTSLPSIRVGSETLNNGGTYRFEFPALAADEKRAAVIAADGTTVEVRLDTLAVTADVLSRSPAMVRKQGNGSTRTARWIDGNTIAVTGSDASFDGTVQRFAPAGLTFVDTRDWSTRRIDSDTTDLAPSGFGPGCIVCGGVLVAYGSNGVVGYDTDGALRFRVSGKWLGPPMVAGSYAYIATDTTHFTIVDTWTGNVVKTVETQLPTVLARMFSY